MCASATATACSHCCSSEIFCRSWPYATATYPSLASERAHSTRHRVREARGTRHEAEESDVDAGALEARDELRVRLAQHVQLAVEAFAEVAQFYADLTHERALLRAQLADQTREPTLVYVLVQYITLLTWLLVRHPHTIHIHPLHTKLLRSEYTQLEKTSRIVNIKHENFVGLFCISVHDQ